MLKDINCGELNKSEVGKKVTLAGWVHRRRDHGGLLFIDLRDRSGLVQVVFNPELSPQMHQIAETLRNEWVVQIIGEVIPRPEGTENLSMKILKLTNYSGWNIGILICVVIGCARI